MAMFAWTEDCTGVGSHGVMVGCMLQFSKKIVVYLGLRNQGMCSMPSGLDIIHSALGLGVAGTAH